MSEPETRNPPEATPGWLRLSFLAPLVAAGLLLGLFPRVVDLTPQVSSTFFFAKDDPALAESARIAESFPAGDELLVLAVSAPDIATEAYRQGIEDLSARIREVPRVESVKSITEGPRDLQDARESPVWSRLLLSPSGDASHVLILHAVGSGGTVVPALEALAREHSREGFEIRISGAPFAVEMIRRNLESDLRNFTTTALAVFAVMILVVFRSLWVLAGMIVATVSAMLLTLILQVPFGGSIGLLTANVATIVAVIAQSHVVFLTANLRSARREGIRDPKGLLGETLRRTFPASLWCALTTGVGFASLLFVPAQPLQDLGLSGSIGTLAALLCAYLLFPPFLVGHATWLSRRETVGAGRSVGSAGRRLALPALVGALLLASIGAGIPLLETDPPLLEYFAKGRPLRQGIEYVDRNMGISPLQIVVRHPGGKRFEKPERIDRLWELQHSLEEHPAVGAVLSLPVVLAEGRRFPILGRIVPTRWLLALLESDELGAVARGFVGPERREAMFLATMREGGRAVPRAQVLDDVRGLAADAGLEVVAIGSLYALQGHLGTLVRSSLLSGILALVALFAVVALASSRSLGTSCAMLGSIALVPLATLGGLGWLGVPVDVISSPASNVCVGMAADAMIHLVLAVRRLAAGGPIRFEHWIAARREQAAPIVIAAGVVCAGFAIFALSTFPPTQRFGLAVVFGTLVAVFGALVLLPALAAPRQKR